MKVVSKRAAVFGIVVALVAFVWILFSDSIEDAIRLTNTEPKFVVKNEKTPDTVVVLVHGVFGDTVGTWRNQNGVAFYDLLSQTAEFKEKFDVFAFGFTSNYIKEGSFSIGEAAKRLKLYADNQLGGYKRIVFIAHSMGGLVTMRYILLDRRMARRVPLLVLFSTPQDANQVAAVADKVAKNDGLADMQDARENRFFDDLDDNWRAIGAAGRPFVVCAYEKRPTFKVMIVPRPQATRYCDESSSAIDASHITIVKPDSEAHDAYQVALRAIRPYISKPAKYVSPYSDTEDSEIAGLEALIEKNRVDFPKEAMKDIKILQEKFPKYANGYRLEGVANWNLGKIDAALEAYAKGMKFEVSEFVMNKLLFNQAAALLALGRYTEAAPLLAKLELIDITDDDVRILRALEKLHEGDFVAATTGYRELLHLDTPGAKPFVRMALGFSLALSGTNSDLAASKFIREAITYDTRLRGVFVISSEPLMFQGWNYAVFRTLYEKNKNRPAFRGLALDRRT